MRRITLLLLTLVLLLPGLPGTTQIAAVPPLMNFQGRLTRPDGTPVADGTYTVTFRLFSVPTGGSALWSHTLPVTVRNGTFAVLLGGTTGTKSGPLNSTLFAGNRWLETQLGVDPALSPRQQIVSVGYAMKADSVKDGSITTNSLANNAVTGAKIADGTITTADFAPNLLNPLAWLLGGNSGVTSGFLGTTDDQPLIFRTNNTERMRILSNGNVGIGSNLGIGTNAPLAPLHITSRSGLIIGQNPASGGFTALKIDLSFPSGGYAALQSVKSSGSSWGDLILNADGGNVGIGTTVTSAKLHVLADNTSSGIYADNTELNGAGVVGEAIYGDQAKGVYGRSGPGWGIYSGGRAGGTSGWNSSSDARYKQNVATLQNPLDTILNLRGVTFDWKRDEYPDMNFTKGRQIGFIAQEVEPFLPEIVHTDGKGYKSVTYANVVPVLVEAVKQQQRQIAAQQKQQETDRAEIRAVRVENAALKQQLSALLESVRQIRTIQENSHANATSK